MDDAPRTPSLPAQALASLAGSRLTSLATTLWWVAASFVALLAYLDSAAQDGLLAPAGGAAFLAGACVVAAVARNASADAHEPGSVRRGSLLRAASLGVIVHGGLLGAVTIFGQSSLGTVALVLGGAALVVVTRPTTLVAMGVQAAPAASGALDASPRRAQSPHELSIPQIVGELRSTAHEVRSATDPSRKEEIAVRRGELLDVLAQRDPETLMSLVDDASVRPRAGEGPDGPVPA
jgi:hypothetical protein